MTDALSRYLDGEIEARELGPEERSEARAWEALFADLKSDGPGRAPAGLADRVLVELEIGAAGASSRGSAAPAEPSGPTPARVAGAAGWLRSLGWLVRPVRVPVPPAVALAAGVILALALWPRSQGAPTGQPEAALLRPASLTAPSGVPRVYVELQLRAPDAASVSVAGDFTNWKPTIALSDPDGDGVWTGLVPMGPGVHQYMFVVDGTEWVTDPGAERHVDDGFGHRNAVVAVTAPAGA